MQELLIFELKLSYVIDSKKEIQKKRCANQARLL